MRALFILSWAICAAAIAMSVQSGNLTATLWQVNSALWVFVAWQWHARAEGQP